MVRIVFCCVWNLKPQNLEQEAAVHALAIMGSTPTQKPKVTSPYTIWDGPIP